MANKSEKGIQLEEMLRNYFLKNGYFVSRGVPFKYEGFNVTDVDLWLYGRTSSVSREVIIVDIKNKKTPQAIERIFWIYGLKNAINANKAIIATTDKRREVKNFGSDLDVVVLDGNFLSKLKKSGCVISDRLTDEEFFGEINKYSLGRLDGDWKGRVLESKGLLANGLGFDACNQWLEHAGFFAQQTLVTPNRAEIACRCFYLISSYICLAIDYLLRELSFISENERSKTLKDGFTHGTRGKIGTDKLLNFSLSLVEQYSSSGATVSREVRDNIVKQLSNLPTPILSDYFSQNDVAKTLFGSAKVLEELATAKMFKSHLSFPVNVRSVLGVFLDYWGMDRKLFDNNIESFSN